ncbi:hypothetical protein CAOG_02155 [Capsaspora owczarzaki ATCC 30864]|uniref:PH domain-containing protein n=1 Tax=Capsaspora owczarzaki (strain ATCC 30864) TaxID=595528 RepID=A0A0D2VLD8_CAPO3|nr:hypothetical protein CAOG_02155 [Capsaspora owczarzaki ATCC 30864]KJE90927.1 hypothetical protein CAOG_002155 [Capsaspora owczarzaki ATCC 30864]|eukprot:XP_004348905.1 hypothetical protein CAOG_02155 [Capsaspora owczarzaki ATCC 30864]
MAMNGDDKKIYNLVQEHKPSYETLHLGNEDTIKEGLLTKIGGRPKTIQVWEKRHFAVKGNFAYYFSNKQPVTIEPCKGVIYLKGATISKAEVGFKKFVIKIEPTVARKPGWDLDETSWFHLCCKDEQEQSEWIQVLGNVSSGHQ